METKKCTVCGRTLEMYSFYKRSDGRIRSECKECSNDKAKINYLNNKESINKRNNENYAQKKEEYSEVRKRYRRSEHGRKILAQGHKKYTNSEKGKQNTKESIRRWADKNREKLRAHWRVKSAIKRGLLVRLPCSICGDIKSDAHHEDYTKPLDVVWLCVTHHKLLHRKDYQCVTSTGERQE